jgi:hypothetical protein
MHGSEHGGGAVTAALLKGGLVAGLGLLLAVLVFQLPPIPQDLAYHVFADVRPLLGIPNFLNVATSLGFAAAGAAGMLLLARHKVPGGLPGLFRVYQVFFLALLLVGPGSAYYHLSPSNATLVWDRLPMSLAFMAFFSAMVGERICVAAGRRLLVPLLMAGVLAVGYWQLSEQRGAGDLRPYLLVQFLPMLLVPVMLLFRSPLSGGAWIWTMLLVYAASKAAELGDAAVLQQSGVLSGHSLKHLLATLGGLLFLGALLARRPVGRRTGDVENHDIQGEHQ